MEPTIEVAQQIKQISIYPAGKARSAYVQELADTYNISVSTVYRWHRDMCSDTGTGTNTETSRKARLDKGNRQLSDEQAHTLASMIFATKRLSKKILMSAKTAQEIAADNNMGHPDVSTSTINRRLRELSLSKAKMIEPSPSIKLITEHPNQLWEFDVSNCIQYFLPEPDAKNNNAGLQERDVEMTLYKNKLDNLRAIKKELLRYLAVDHCSGAFFVQYFYTTGETALNAAEFFLSAFKQKQDERYRFHGVPFNLYLDRGSAVQSGIVQSLLTKLNINCITHMPGNPRAKGQVEGLHDYVERTFECLLKFHSPRSLEELNGWVLDWTIKVNAAEIFRKTAPRSQLWSYITSDQLRLCPPDEVYRKLLVSKPETRKVANDLKISYEGKVYIVPNPNLKGEEVSITYSPYEYPNISLSHDSLPFPLCLSPCQEPDQFGRITDGAVVFQVDEDGKLKYRRPQDTATQTGLKAAESKLEALGLTMKGTGDKRRAVAPAVGQEKLTVFGHQADKIGNVAYMDRPGTALPIEKVVEVQALSWIKAAKRIVEQIGRGLTPQENEWIQTTYGSTVPENEIDVIINRLSGAMAAGSMAAGSMAAGSIAAGENTDTGTGIRRLRVAGNE